jgi:hypothetical protein
MTPPVVGALLRAAFVLVIKFIYVIVLVSEGRGCREMCCGRVVVSLCDGGPRETQWAHADGCCPDGLGPADDPGLRSIDQLVSHFTYLGRGFASGRFAGGLLGTGTRSHDDAFTGKFDYRRKSVCDEVGE